MRPRVPGRAVVPSLILLSAICAVGRWGWNLLLVWGDVIVPVWMVGAVCAVAALVVVIRRRRRADSSPAESCWSQAGLMLVLLSAMLSLLWAMTCSLSYVRLHENGEPCPVVIEDSSFLASRLLSQYRVSGPVAIFEEKLRGEPMGEIRAGGGCVVDVDW